MNIVLYSTDCPKCKILKQKLDSKSIRYTVCDSVDDMLALGIMQVPVLSVEEELYGFQQANEWVNHYQTEEEPGNEHST